MPKKAKSKQRSKPKLNIKKSKKGRRAAPPKRRKVAVSIPALEAAATEAAVRQRGPFGFNHGGYDRDAFDLDQVSVQAPKVAGRQDLSVHP
ncbi:MAG TPA: hypothetical protein VGD41_12500 [Pyrinomonadaceae bacterium]